MTGWTLKTLKKYFESQLTDLRTALDERYATQTKATDAAFVAQQTAMKTAFDAADKAVQAALAAAEKAASKAESAAGERFKATNEFRGQLADQAATLISRVEHAASYQAVADKIDALTERVSNLELRLTSRLDQSTGRQEGARASYSLLLAGVSILIALGSVLAIIFH